MGSVWIALSVIAVIAVLLKGGKPNAVGGGLCVGLVAGLIGVIAYRLMDGIFHWMILWKITVVFVLLGLLLEIPRILGALRKIR